MDVTNELFERIAKLIDERYDYIMTNNEISNKMDIDSAGKLWIISELAKLQLKIEKLENGK